jgi:hypothetical protein
MGLGQPSDVDCATAGSCSQSAAQQLTARDRAYVAGFRDCGVRSAPHRPEGTVGVFREGCRESGPLSH